MKKRFITTQKVINYFRKQGEELTVETLDLMYFLSGHIVKRLNSILRKKERIRSRLKDIFYHKKIRLPGNSMMGLEPKNQALLIKKGIFENIFVLTSKHRTTFKTPNTL